MCIHVVGILWGVILVKWAYAGLEHRRMGEIMSWKICQVKQIYGVVFLYYTYVNFTQAAFPLERDVNELVGVSQHKQWIVFVEKLAMICLSETKSNTLLSLIDVFRCTHKYYTTKCLIKHSGACRLIPRYPNVLRFVYLDFTGHARPLQYSVKIILHRKFSLNITVVYSFVPYRRGFPFESTSFTIAGKKFTGRKYPITFMYPNNTAKVAFSRLYNNHALIEYSVAQYLSVKGLRQKKSEAVPFSWSYFVVRMFHIQVDTRARLVFDVISCVLCKLIVYDGPNERLPVIMKIKDAYMSEKVMASTFQVFVVIVEDLQQEKTMNYFAAYIKTAVFNITDDEHHQISFDNSTNCFGHSMSARLCVYTFYTFTLRKIHFSLTAVQFTGGYQGEHFSPGIVLYNEDNGTTAKIFKLSHKVTDLDIISTGKTLHLAVFVYSVFASLSHQFSMSTTNCNVLLVSKHYMSYSGHMTPMDNIRRTFKINYMDFDECFQLQFISSLHKVNIILPPYTPVLIKIYQYTLSSYYTFGCNIHYHQGKYRPYTFDRKIIRTYDNGKAHTYNKLLYSWPM